MFSYMVLVLTSFQIIPTGLRNVIYWICKIMYFPLPTLVKSDLTLHWVCVHTHTYRI